MEKVSRAKELEQKRSYWEQHIESWQESGLSQTEYCLRHDLKPHQLTYWKKRFCKTKTGVSFVPLQLVAPSSADSLCLVIQLKLHNGSTLIVKEHFDGSVSPDRCLVQTRYEIAVTPTVETESQNQQIIHQGI